MLGRLLHWFGPGAALFLAIVLLLALANAFTGRGFDLGAYTSIQFVLNTNASALASTLGILMAIVLLMVQLTAQRYSFNIIGIFVANPRNVSLVALFILTISFNLWLAAEVDDGYIPAAGTYLALAMGTVCFGLLIPYFAYLFDALTPHNILNTLQRDALSAVDSAIKGRSLAEARRMAAERIQHTGDITRTASSLSDAAVARHSVWILYGTFCGYLERKPRLPREWFTIEDRFYQGRHALILKDLEESGTWLERRIFEEFQTAFSSSLNRLEPVNTTVALCCRLAGEQALELRDEAALRLLMKFFHTFLRAALNARDARAGYHLLYQYALLADAAFEVEPTVALEIADRISYYGDTAIGMGVLWMAIAAAQDLRTLAEASVTRGMPHETTSRIQGELMDLVQMAESKKEIRRSPTANLLQKAGLALGAFHLDRGNHTLAAELARAFNLAHPRDLGALIDELAAVIEPEFWELTDRVVNFEYVVPGRRARLAEFLSLIESEQAASGRLPESAGLPD